MSKLFFIIALLVAAAVCFALPAFEISNAAKGLQFVPLGLFFMACAFIAERIPA